MGLLTAWVEALCAPVHAVPVDLFRVLAGAVGAAYFASAYRHAPDFSHPDGLIDHALARRLLPPSRLTLFHPRMPARAFRPLFALGVAASGLVVLGVGTRWAAAYLFVLSVSTYRWNILVVYVDDAITHLVFFWLLVLPVGETLTVAPLLGLGGEPPGAWSSVVVPGAAVRLFLANMALVYVVAGGYKVTSPMWRDGSALHAILKMPIAHAPDLWAPRHGALLRALTWGALVLEPLFALVFVLPAGSPAKAALVAGAAAFHIGIVAALKIPFANFAMLGALPLALREEWMEGLLGRPDPAVLEAGVWGGSATVAAVLVGALSLMVLWELARSARWTNIPLGRTHVSGFMGNPFCVALWLVGIGQSYRLFDWIDDRNHHARFEVRLLDAEGGAPREVPSAALFPTTLRHLLLQSYLVGNVWLRLADAEGAELRRALLERHARRFARRHPDAGTVEVHAITQRVTADNLDLPRGRRRLLLRFTCRGGEATLDREVLEAACAAS